MRRDNSPFKVEVLRGGKGWLEASFHHGNATLQPFVHDGHSMGTYIFSWWKCYSTRIVAGWECHTAKSNSRSKAWPSIEKASPACALVFLKETKYIKGSRSHKSKNPNGTLAEERMIFTNKL